MRENRLYPTAALGLVLLLCSCAKRDAIKAEAPLPAPTPMVAANAQVSDRDLRHYVVQKGDCLWSIAAKPTVLGDAFHWPLLYKQNRDEIQDPDRIEPDQRLAYQSRYSPAELKEADQEARLWPDYKAPKKALDPKIPKD